MSYTPGPWEAFYKRKYDEWHVSVPMEDSSMRLGLFADGVKTTCPKADAYLIAAAPELYEALEAMQKAVDEFFLKVSLDSTGVCLFNRRPILDRAQKLAAEALAKAGGKEEE